MMFKFDPTFQENKVGIDNKLLILILNKIEIR